MDKNDNSPEFRPNSCYTLAVPENQEIFGIHTVAATDLDEGNNGEISYSIASESPVHLSSISQLYIVVYHIYRLHSLLVPHTCDATTSSSVACA